MVTRFEVVYKNAEITVKSQLGHEWFSIGFCPCFKILHKLTNVSSEWVLIRADD